MKPGDFYVGVIDLFSVLLPGALLAGAIAILFPMPAPLHELFGSEAAKWAAFALAAYALGHFMFLTSAWLDEPYDTYREKHWPDEELKPFRTATTLRCAYFDNGRSWEEDRPMNTFKWAKAVLAIRAPATLADVNRYEADSKFFRSLVFVLPIVGAVGAFELTGLLLPAGLFLSWLSFTIYARLRYKSTDWAYHYVIVLDRLGELERRPPATATPAAPAG